MKNKIIEILKKLLPGADCDFATEDGLISNEIITSFDLIMLISLLNEEFDVKINIANLSPENFETVDDIEQLIKDLK